MFGNRKTRNGLAACIALLTTTFLPLSAAEPAKAIREMEIAGGIVAQVGSDDLALQELGKRFHIRLLLPDPAAVAKAQAAIDKAGLQGRFTASMWDGKTLPFAERTLNAIVVAKDGLVPETEAFRALAPRGLLISPAGAKPAPVPKTIDDWTHYLYNAGGNAVSKDAEVAPPQSFRWWAPPLHLRSHNHGASFTGLISANGRVFHLLDEGTYLFDKGGATERWSLVARDAFNGAFLWKLPLTGYGQPFFEDTAGQAVNDFIWRSPMSANRRVVAQGDRVYAALCYRQGPLSVLDAGTGKTIHAVDVGGIVDEIIADGDLAICRVRKEIAMPSERLRGTNAIKTQKELAAQGIKDPKEEYRTGLVYDSLTKNENETLVAVDAAQGQVLWRRDGPLVGTQSFVMADGKVVYHNYDALIALDVKTGKELWRFDNPARNRMKLGSRNLLGNLLVADGKVLWTSSAAGGGYALSLADGKLLWRHLRMGTTGGFGAPTGIRVIRDDIYWDFNRSPIALSDGKEHKFPDIGDMLKRGHHVRCIAGKATEHYLILPQRGAEYVDLLGGDHMTCDWIRGACSYGLMPANGMTYVTPDPCSCYAGARIIGFLALSAKTPVGLEQAPAPSAPERLAKGPAMAEVAGLLAKTPGEDAWPTYLQNCRRTGFATTVLSAQLKPTWQHTVGGELAQTTIAHGRIHGVNKATSELFCLHLADGQPVWRRSFPGALDGPPTLVGEALFIGCRDGSVTCLRAADGALAWRHQAAPLDRLTLHNDRLESLWPVSSSMLYHNELIYAVAGRNSYLDGGIRLVALDPATGELRHHGLLESPWPDKETLRTAVVTETDLKNAKSPEGRQLILGKIDRQYATGYHILGGEADLLVTDGTNLYMTQNEFDAKLNHIPRQRSHGSGYTPMGGLHLLANFGLLDDTMFHRTGRIFCDAWPAYGTGAGSAARGGSFVAVGAKRAYAAQHWEQGGYAFHKPGSGNRIVADALDTKNLNGGEVDAATHKATGMGYGGEKGYYRTAKSIWQTPTPVIVRAMLAAPDGQGGELVFAAGIVEGKTLAEWDKSTYYEGPGKFQVFNGADGKLLAEYDLPACPVHDGMSAAGGKLLIALVNGQLVSFQPK